MEEEKMDTTPQQGQKLSIESLSKEEIINKYKGLLGIAKKAKLAKDEISEENRLLKEQLEQHETQKEADKKALMAMKEMLEAYTENKLQLTTQVTELQKQRKLDCEALEKFSIENESLKRQLQRLTEDNESLLTDIENMETQLQQVSGFGKEQKQHLALLEKEVQQLKEVEVQRQELQLKNEELFKELNELKEKYKFIKDINAEQRQKFNSLKDRFIEVLKKLKKLKECKRILLETQHEYADSVSQWQNEIINASKILCRELNNLKEENMVLLKKLGEEQPNKDNSSNFITVEKLNELLELSEKAKIDYQHLKKENLQLKQNLGYKVTDSTTTTLKTSIDKLDEIWHLSKTAFQDYQNIQEENFKLKDKAQTTNNQDQIDTKLDFDMCYRLTLQLEDLQKLADTASKEYQNQSQELQQLKLDYEKLLQKDNQLLVKELETQNNNESLQCTQIKCQELVQKLKAIEQKIFENQIEGLEVLQLDLKTVNKEKEDLQEKLQQDADTLQQMQNTLKSQNCLQDSLEKSQMEVKTLQEKLLNLEQQNQIDKQNFDKEKQQLQEKLLEITITTQQDSEISQQMKEAEKSLRESLKKSKIEIQTLQENIQILQQQAQEDKSNFDKELEKETKEKLMLTTKLQEEIKSSYQLKDELLDLANTVEDYHRMYDQQKLEHCELLDEMREFNEVLKGRGDLISRQQEEQQILKTELKTNAEKLAKIQKQLDEKEKQLNENQSQLETITKEMVDTKQKLQLIENSNSLNEEKVRVLSTELEMFKSQPTTNDFDNQSDVMSTSTISRADELQRLRDVEDSFEDKYNKLRGLAAKLKKKLQEETAIKQRLEKELQDLKIQESEMKSQLEDYNIKITEINSLQKQINDKQKHIDALKTENQKLKSSRKQANVLNLEIEAAEKSLTDVTTKLANRTTELDAAQESIKSKESTIIQLRKEIELLESSKAAELKHSQELKQQIDHLQKTLKDEMHSKQQAFEKSKILEQDVENLKLELENVKIELAQTTSNQGLTMSSLKSEKEHLSLQLSTIQATLAECEQKLKQSERCTEDLRVEYLDYKVKAQAVLRKNQNRDSSKEKELEEELLNMRATEIKLNTSIQTLTGKMEALEKQNQVLTDDNINLQKRSKELMQLIEEIRSQNESLSQEIQQHIQQQHETLKQHRQQIESMDNCHKEQLLSLNNSHQRQLEQLRKELTAHIRLPPSVGATKSIASTYHHLPPSNDPLSSEQSKLDFLFMEREDAEGSEEAAETLANLAASRKISNASSSKRSNHHHDFMPLDELLNTPLNAIQSETLISSTQQVPDMIIPPSNNSEMLQLELNTTKERLQKQESRVRHLTALLAENEQDLARLTQMNDMLKEELRRQERSVEREQHMHNSEYIKNVIMKFLTLNNADEKTRLVPVLNTILKLSRSETEMLNCVAKGQKVSEPTQRAGGWGNFLPWGGSSSTNNDNSSNN